MEMMKIGLNVIKNLKS